MIFVCLSAVGHKEIMDGNHKTLRTVGKFGKRISGLHDVSLYPELINEQGQYETDETEVEAPGAAGRERRKQTRFSKLDKEDNERNVTSRRQVKEEEDPVNIGEVTGLQDYNLRIVTIKEEKEYEKEESDIQRVIIQSDSCAGPSDVKPSVEQEEPTIQGHQQIKEEEIPVNINEGGLMCKNATGVHQGSVQVVISDTGVSKSYPANNTRNKKKAKIFKKCCQTIKLTCKSNSSRYS
ncbi:uncharacterized protein O3C94_022074 [Discoglossus pictus]